ncbi:hypothetical protein DQ04_01091090 [Trypanosoma grayi]|uniref:hypothetical protein n=1 Tax=Trypanosoma grayi TaxID=71804 RepID=UPI0004F4B41A|nr:hypothetical protein DQ04_01091090 [Trypanosoma grayi]KEG13302.1 hypothetical protein DQ04_01091090 [Trypanosoma grayi]
MESRRGSSKSKTVPKPRGIRQAAGSRVLASTATEAASRRQGSLAASSKRKGRYASPRPGTNQGRVVVVKWSVASNTNSAVGRRYGSMSTIASTRQWWNNRSLRSLVVSIYCTLFVAAMRRVVIRHRKWVVWENIEKPRAAFKIQTAWRARQQRRRMRHEAAARVLVPFLREKIGRILAAKEKSALLLQRVFRSQKERHFTHWLYEQMKYNRALHVVRQHLKQYMAKRCLLFLTLQRDERQLCEECCAMAARCLIRKERAELLNILHWMNTASQETLTPMVPRSMLDREITRCTGYCPCPPPPLHVEVTDSSSNPSAAAPASSGVLPLEGNPLDVSSVEAGNSGKSGSTSSIQSAGSCVMGLGDDSVSSWISALHTEEGARQLLDELFGRKSPSYPLLRGSSERCPSSDADSVAHNTSHPFVYGSQQCETRHQLQALCLSLPRPPSLKEGEGDICSSNVVQQQQTLSLNTAEASLHRVVDAFTDLIVRTEAIERKALELDLQNRHSELMHQIDWFAVTVQATHASPPLYASLLSNMKEPWAVRRAEQLFCQEHEERLRLVEEYQAMPLRFLNRPLLNFVAEERRRRLRERVQTMNGVEKGAEAAAEEEDKKRIQPSPFSITAMHSRWPPNTDITPIRSFHNASQSPAAQRKGHDACTLSWLFPGPSEETTQLQHQQHLPKKKDSGSALRPTSSTMSQVVSQEAGLPFSQKSITPSVDDAFSDSRSGMHQDVTMRESPRGTNSKTVLPSFLSFFTPPTNTRNVNIVDLSSSALSRNQSSLSADSENAVFPRIKVFSSTSSGVGGGMDATDDNNNSAGASKGPKAHFHLPVAPSKQVQYDAGDSETALKSTSSGNHGGCGSSMPRGVPIPLLRASPNLERSTVPSLPHLTRTPERECVLHKESGADYVRSCRLRTQDIPKEAHETPLLESRQRMSPLPSPAPMEGFASFKVRVGRATNPRLKKLMMQTAATTLGSGA